MAKAIKFLKKLVETPSPTGREVAVADLVRERLSNVADEIQTDTMGSVHAILKGNVELAEEKLEEKQSPDQYDESAGEIYENDGAYSEDYAYTEVDLDAAGEHYLYSRSAAPTLMLASHMDEVGLMVTYISDDGFISFSSVGGVDAAILPGMRVDVHSSYGTLRGVVGRKPIHLIDSEERKNVTEMDKLVVDLGMKPADVKKRVRVGDQITYGVGFERLGKDMAVSKSFDDKSGVFVACRVMEELARDARPDATFIAAITVQEEIGTRGAITSAHSINPDVAIAFDVTHATDYPGIDKSKYGEIICGEGPVIARGPNINPLVFERLVAAAEAEEVPYQLEAEPSVTGTDARAIQVAQGGIPTGLISIPLRYMHTPAEMINLKDLEGAIKIITRFAKDLHAGASFIPGISAEIEHPDAANLNHEKKSDKEKIADLKKEVKKLKNRLASVEQTTFNQAGNLVGQYGVPLTTGMQAGDGYVAGAAPVNAYPTPYPVYAQGDGTYQPNAAYTGYTQSDASETSSYEDGSQMESTFTKSAFPTEIESPTYQNGMVSFTSESIDGADENMEYDDVEDYSEEIDE